MEEVDKGWALVKYREKRFDAGRDKYVTEVFVHVEKLSSLDHPNTDAVAARDLTFEEACALQKVFPVVEVYAQSTQAKMFEDLGRELQKAFDDAYKESEDPK